MDSLDKLLFSVKQKVHVAKKTVDPAFERKREQFRAVQKAVDKFNDATEGQRKALRDFSKSMTALCESGGRDVEGARGESLEKAGIETSGEVARLAEDVRAASAPMDAFAARVRACEKLVKDRDGALKDVDMLEEQAAAGGGAAAAELRTRLDCARSRYERLNECAAAEIATLDSEHRAVVVESTAAVARLYAAFFRRCAAVYAPWEHASAASTASAAPAHAPEHRAVPPPRPAAPVGHVPHKPLPAPRPAGAVPPPRPPKP